MNNKGISKDRIKEEIKRVKNKMSIFFWIAMGFGLPGLMIIVMSFMIRGAIGGKSNLFLIAGILVTLIGIFFGKKYLGYKNKYKELKEKL